MTDEQVRTLAESVFGDRGRVLQAHAADFGARLLVRVDHIGAVKASELVELARRFDVVPDAVELWDLGPNQMEIRIDLDAITPPARPSRMPPGVPDSR